MDLIVKTVFGSRLYGTSTPDSDTDYLGVFMPTKEQILLNKIPESVKLDSGSDKRKNTKYDTDFKVFSLHYFLKLAQKGETEALDMLHAPDGMIIERTPAWDSIVANREKFYTKKLKAFVGFAKRQAEKYTISAGRANDCKRVIDFLKGFNRERRLIEFWNYLPTGGSILKYEGGKVREYEVCQKKVQETVTVEYALNVFETFYKKYGQRVKDVANNKNIDWKAVSHAMRAAYEIKSIYLKNTIIFPLPEADYLKKVKLGFLDYKSEVAPTLEKLMDEVERLSEESNLPEKVDQKFWNDFIIDVMGKEVKCLKTLA